MKRNLFKSFVVAVAALAGLTACNMNELVDVNRSADLINFTVLTGGMTKAVDVTTANLAQFEVTAFNHGTETSPYINAVSYTGGSGTFASATPYYWPEGNLDFYAWSTGAAEGQVTKTSFKSFTVTPSSTPAEQVDLIFAGKTNIGKGNSTDGAIALNFRHAESKVVVKVKNTAPNLKFVISDWRLGFIDDAGTFTYAGQGAQYDGSTDGNNSAQLAASMWSGNTDAAASKMYTNILASNVNIAANASETLLDGEMIVIPQTVTAASAHASATSGAAVNGSYVGLKIKILNRDNDAVIYSDGASGTAWAIWPADFNFEPGKKYTFTVDLCGGGYYETNHDANTDLDPILEGAVISFASVTVDDFSSQSAVELVAPAPDPANGHAYVDLGLRSGGNKILFATMNIGASAPQEYGDYFAWGETSKRYTSISGSSIIGGMFEDSNAPFWNGSAWTKYNDTDNKLTLDAADDVASVMWGGEWRIPDKADLEFLLNSTYCTAAWTADYNSTGIAGLVVTGKGDYAGNSIFLPAAGSGYGDSVGDAGDCGYCWSRSRLEGGADLAYYLNFGEGGRDVSGGIRYCGSGVRPVLVIPE